MIIFKNKLNSICEMFIICNLLEAKSSIDFFKLIIYLKGFYLFIVSGLLLVI